ncbi:MAG: bifunctional DNA-formamidopyrimidine glycosylase/DNA-(apurinic or apyrimidinic site) lyase [Pseudobdellovibrionaceae bacterium]
MPELPEVETVLRGLEPYIKGQEIADLTIGPLRLRKSPPASFGKNLRQTRIEDMTRRGKYLVLHLSNSTSLIHHLGMSGSFRFVGTDFNDEPRKHDHLIYRFSSGDRLIYNDPRRFGMLIPTPRDMWHQAEPFRNMGFEPFDAALTPEIFHGLFKNKSIAIKLALLDQSLVCGIGNIYACEALYLSRISPLLPAQDLSLEQAARLLTAVRQVLNEAIQSGGSSLRDHKQVNGELGYFQHRFAVYDRRGKPCPECTCDVSETGGIRVVSQGGRSSFFCPVFQNITQCSR